MYEWLLSVVEWAVDKIYNVIVDIVNECILQAAELWQYAIDILPDDLGIDSVSLPDGVVQVLGWVNWFVPLDFMVNCIVAYVSVYIAYMGVKPLLRFARVL